MHVLPPKEPSHSDIQQLHLTAHWLTFPSFKFLFVTINTTSSSFSHLMTLVSCLLHRCLTPNTPYQSISNSHHYNNFHLLSFHYVPSICSYFTYDPPNNVAMQQLFWCIEATYSASHNFKWQSKLKPGLTTNSVLFLAHFLIHWVLLMFYHQFSSLTLPVIAHN